MRDEISGHYAQRLNLETGVVVIGRNEGERLKNCFESLAGARGRIVYVDSGSTDGSLDYAESKDVVTVALDMRKPFSAARARNEGYRKLRELLPSVDYVQFVDGDCTIDSMWLDAASAFLMEHPDVAVVCGRLRERFPNKSVYNLLCDMEWDIPAGEAEACGGIAMMRSSAFEVAGGFRADLIAGEEPELCVRLRSSGWRIWRLDREMGTHDAAILRFRQWWIRTMRGGHAYAEGAMLHRSSPFRHNRRDTRSIWFWGLLVPLAALGLTVAFGAGGLLILLVYPIQVTRLAIRGNRSVQENWLRAVFLVLGKFPEMLGQIKFLFNHHIRRHSRLIEYK